jgi:hypothetical protein
MLLLVPILCSFFQSLISLKYSILYCVCLGNTRWLQSLGTGDHAGQVEHIQYWKWSELSPHMGEMVKGEWTPCGGYSCECTLHTASVDDAFTGLSSLGAAQGSSQDSRLWSLRPWLKISMTKIWGELLIFPESLFPLLWNGVTDRWDNIYKGLSAVAPTESSVNGGWEVGWRLGRGIFW